MKQLRIRQRVRVNTLGGVTLEGVLVSKRGGFITLAAPKVEKDGELVEVTGSIYVPRSNVEFIQAVGGV